MFWNLFDDFLKEVVRVLKPSSYFLITDFRPASELDILSKEDDKVLEIPAFLRRQVN